MACLVNAIMCVVCVTLYETGLIYMTWNYTLPCNGAMSTAIGVPFSLGIKESPHLIRVLCVSHYMTVV